MSGVTPRRDPFPTPEQVRRLPCYARVTIGPEHLDAMGHMNIRWYMALYDQAAWEFFAAFGMDEAYFREHHGGGFALEHHLRYLAEVLPGDEVAVHVRLLGYSVKRIHFMGFMVNETQNRLASTIEALGAHADTILRRITPFPPTIAANLAALLTQHNALDWHAPLFGVIHI